MKLLSIGILISTSVFASEAVPIYSCTAAGTYIAIYENMMRIVPAGSNAFSVQTQTGVFTNVINGETLKHVSYSQSQYSIDPTRIEISFHVDPVNGNSDRNELIDASFSIGGQNKPAVKGACIRNLE